DAVDLVDQLWAYLIRGLQEVSNGRAFSTSYPDMPLEIALEPKGRNVTIRVDANRGNREVTVPLDDLRAAMVTAARTFFERLKPHVKRHQTSYDRLLTKLATMK